MKILIAAFLFLISNNSIAGSYEDDLKELFELTGVVNNYIGLNTVMINQMQASFFQAAGQNIDAASFSEAQKKQAGEILKDRFTQMVRSYEEYVGTAMPYDKVVSEIYIPLYKETYSQSEVKELIVFYSSPVGKKTIETSQKISQQAAERSAEKYDVFIVDFIEKQIDENIAIAKKEIANQVGK